MSAIVQAMKQMECVGIVRKVYSDDRGLSLGILYPFVEEIYSNDDDDDGGDVFSKEVINRPTFSRGEGGRGARGVKGKGKIFFFVL
mgnify:CR=1 FL=1